MPKRPGRKRGVEYDRLGRPMIGITSTESSIQKPVPEKEEKAEAVEDEDGETEES